MHTPHGTLARGSLVTLLALLLAVPWIHPFSWGPSPDMLQRLITAGCGAGFLLVWALGRRWLSLHLLARTVAVAWLAAALLSSVMALLQYFGQVDGGLADWITRTDAGSAFANLRQRNQFASLTSIGLVSVLFMAQWQARRLLDHAPLVRQLLLAAAILLLALGNAASSSRTGAVQWLLVAGMALLWDRQGQHPVLRWSVLALCLYLAANLVLPLLLQMQTGQVPLNALDRFNENAGSQSRMVLWGQCAGAHPREALVGLGLGRAQVRALHVPLCRRALQ